MASHVVLGRRTLLRRGLSGALALPAVGLLAACGGAVTVTASTSASAAGSSTASVATVATASPGRTSSSSLAARAEPSPTTPAVAHPTAAQNALQVWAPWGGAVQKGYQDGYAASLAALAAHDPSATATYVYAAFPAKFLAAAAAGTPPDLLFLPPGGQVTIWAYKQLVQSLDGYLRGSRVQASDFVAPAWTMNQLQGRQYAMPVEVDPNFPFAANTALLRQVGISRPPATIAELDDANQKLSQKSDDTITRLGLYPPWLTYGATNALYTYFLMFGGGWFAPNDPSKLQATQDANVTALAWMKKYADQSGGYAAIQKLTGPWGTNGYAVAMSNGTLGMGPMVTASYTEAVSLAKGSAFAGAFTLSAPPVADGVTGDPGWLGGWAMSIPTGARRPDASWTALHWLSGTGDGTDTWAEIAGAFPAYKPSPYLARHAQDPVLGKYLTVLQGARHTHPTELGWLDIPASAFGSLLTETVSGKTAISTALLQFQTVAQAALDRYKGT